MIRLLLIIAIAAAAALLALWAAPEPGRMLVEWRGVQYETSAAVGFVMLVVAAGILALTWRLFSFLWNMPGQIRKWRVHGRAARGRGAYASAIIAIENGDVAEARRQAERAGELFEDPRLSLLARARAAEIDKDWPEAERVYDRLLESSDTRLLARRGLMNAALKRGDEETALIHAEEAFKLRGKASWPTEAAFGLKLANLDFEGALDILEKADRKDLLDDDLIERRRGALHAALAHRAERLNQLDDMRESAQKAVRHAPGFAPGACLAAKAFLRVNQPEKAAETLEKAWAIAPHPVIAALYAGIPFAGETAAQGADRLLKLAELNPGHVEAAYLSAQLATARGNHDAAEKELAPVLRQGASTRACLAMARLAALRADPAEAERWLLIGLSARAEPDWSNPELIDQAFDFSDQEWSRVILHYGDRGELPPLEAGHLLRHLPDRDERPLSLLPAPEAAATTTGHAGTVSRTVPAGPPAADWAPGDDNFS